MLMTRRFFEGGVTRSHKKEEINMKKEEELHYRGVSSCLKRFVSDAVSLSSHSSKAAERGNMNSLLHEWLSECSVVLHFARDGDTICVDN